MGTITPLLDTLLHQVQGRRAALEQAASPRSQRPLEEVSRALSTRSDRFERGGQAQHSRASGSSVEARGVGEGLETTRSSSQSGYTNAGRAGMPTWPGGDSATAAFSRAGRMIAALFARPDDAASPPISAQRSLFGLSGPPSGRALAGILSDQVALSGLFYESHLQQWMEGRRPLEQLRGEPQMRLALKAASMRAGEFGSHSASSVGAPDDGADVIDETTRTLVRQQLDVLSQALFRWEGAPWPGARMQWEISDQDRSQAQDEAPSVPITTRLSLDLPRLGRLELCVSLRDTAADVFVYAENDTTSAAVDDSRSELERRLADAGLGPVAIRRLSDTR